MSRVAFDRDGYQVVEGVVPEEDCDAAVQALASLSTTVGRRDLLHWDACTRLANALRGSVRLKGLLPCGYAAVQCTLFAKDGGRNWLVAPHQDLSIPVRSRVDAPSCGGWSSKHGRWFVQPPACVLEQLIALRVQLDPGSDMAGPLLVLPGSHRSGRLGSAPNLRCGQPLRPCIVGKGGVVAMRPLLVHASSRAKIPLPRRVLHFLFGPPELPLGLHWAQIA